MGYFSNGSEGDSYESYYCANCIHDVNQDCPILLIHLEHNYEQFDNEIIKAILDLLIPRTEDSLDNKQCKMFIKKVEVTPDLFDELE
jgi:hypothetical protein